MARVGTFPPCGSTMPGTAGVVVGAGGSAGRGATVSTRGGSGVGAATVRGDSVVRGGDVVRACCTTRAAGRTGFWRCGGGAGGATRSRLKSSVTLALNATDDDLVT